MDIWAAPAIGVIVGHNGGSSNGKKKGGNYLASVGNVGVSLYGGGIVGAGENVGPYVTGGLIIGSKPDIGVGGGIHVGKRAGIGAIVPLNVFENPATAEAATRAYHALASMASHAATSLAHASQQLYAAASSYIISNGPQLAETARHVYEALSRL